MTGNVLAALGVLDDEDAISNLLHYCVNSSPSFGAAFVSAVQGGQSDRYDEVRAYLRMRVPGVGIPDLLLKLKSGKYCDLVVIENKLTAEEGKNQTKRYGSPSSVPSIRKRLKDKHPSGQWRDEHFAFLTLHPWQKPQNSEQFHHVTYEHLLSAIMPYERGQDALADRLFCNLFDAYSEFYVGGRTHPGDPLLQKWSSNGELDAGFLHFGNVFEGLRYPLGLKVGVITRASKAGRVYYLAQISKDRWRPPASAGKPGFHIHFEPQFNVLSRRFSFYLHYEIRDYRPRAQAVKDFGEELRGYDATRQQFKDYLEKARVPNLLLRGRLNQVGTVRVKLDERTSLGEFSQAACSAIAKVANTIDGFPLLG